MNGAFGAPGFAAAAAAAAGLPLGGGGLEPAAASGEGLLPGGLPFMPNVAASGTLGQLGMMGGGFNAADILTLDAGARLNKNPRQQAANKVSQQRYRERKKARFETMAAEIEAMQEQLRQVQGLQQHNHQLEGQNIELEARLVEREREIEQLKFSLDRLSDRSLEAALALEGAAPLPALLAAVPVLAAAAAASGDSGSARNGGGTRVCCAPLARDLDEIDFEKEFEERMGQLGALVARLGLRDADPTGEGMDAAVLAELALLVGRCCQLRQAAMAAEGAKALRLFSGGRKWVSGLEEGQGHWAEVLQVLKLSEDQQEQLLLLRRTHLQTLRSLYVNRQDLNLEAMALMLPRHSPLLQLDTTIEGKLANMSSRGYLAIARANLELGALLDTVKDTVRLEQRAVMELNSLAITKILTPIQAALYMVLTYPALSDILALINALARHLGEDGLPEQGPCGGACRRAAAAQQRQPPQQAQPSGEVSPVQQQQQQQQQAQGGCAGACKGGACGSGGAAAAGAQGPKGGCSGGSKECCGGAAPPAQHAAQGRAGCCGGSNILPPRTYSVGEGATLSGCHKAGGCCNKASSGSVGAKPQITSGSGASS